MAFSKGNNTEYTWEDITEKYNEAFLTSYYFNVNKIPCLIPSPLRQDRKPSFSFYSYDGKGIFWIDFATKEKGSLKKLFCKLWGMPLPKVITKIKLDLCEDLEAKKIKTSISNKVKVSINKDSSQLLCKIRKWEKHDIEYWKSYGISLKWLKYAEIYPISHTIINSKKGTFSFKADKYAYAYVEHKENKTTIKVYQPFNTNGNKWRNKHDKSVISLWTKVPKNSNKICICSSVKDALCLWANLNIPCIAVQGEGYSLSKTAINELKKRYTNIYIIFDNDEPGIKDSIKLEKETGFTNIILPKFDGGKDISDYYKKYGKEKFKAFMLGLFDAY